VNRPIAFLLMCLSPLAIADNNSSQSSAFGGNAAGGMGGMGGNAAGGSATGIGHGGAGGFGGTGIGNGGTGGTGIGGEAHGGAGGIGQGGIGLGGNGTGGEATNAGNSQSASMNINQERQSPAVFMSAPLPTAPCQATMGGFLSFIGGIGLAGSRTLQECEKRESSRIAYIIGQPKMALELMCMTEYGAKTSACSHK
jgi:hypothetical protein